MTEKYAVVEFLESETVGIVAKSWIKQQGSEENYLISCLVVSCLSCYGYCNHGRLRSIQHSLSSTEVTKSTELEIFTILGLSIQ